MLAAEDFDPPTIALTFSASPRVRDAIARRLDRMPEILSIAIEDARRSVWDIAPKPDARSGW